MFKAVTENEYTKEYAKESAKTGVGKKFRFESSTGAVGGFTGGSLLMTAGFTLSAVSYFSRINFRNPETILLAAGVGFLAVGAHFLDLIERDKKIERIACYEKYGKTINKSGEFEFVN